MNIFNIIFAVFCGYLLCIHESNGEKARFDNYKVYTIKIDTAEQLHVLRDIETHSDDYEVWKSAAALGHSADIMVPPHKLGHFHELINDFNIEYNIKIENVQELIDNEQRDTVKPRAFGWGVYYTYDEIYQWIFEQEAIHPQLTTRVIGTSHRGNDILSVAISYKEGNPKIFIEANIHAREWITSATVTWLINEFLTSEDPIVRDLAENIDWIIVPIFNVDGFIYAHTTNRLWRKTRQLHATICYGTDANRNFPYKWGQGGSSQDPCSDTFMGPTELSEPESVVLDAFLAEHAENTNIYIAFHSYGQYVLLPYGDTDDVSWNHDNLMYVGNAAARGFSNLYNTTYTVGPTHTVLYATTGTTADWAFDSYGIRISYTFEFRDTGTYGFVLPAAQIVPNARETLDALVEMVAAAREVNELTPIITP